MQQTVSTGISRRQFAIAGISAGAPQAFAHAVVDVDDY